MRKKVLSVFLALVMALCITPMTAMAEGEENSWDIANGDITVTATVGGQTVTQGSESLTAENPIITGSSDQYKLTITAESGATSRVTLSNLNINIDPNNGNAAAIKTSGDGAVIIELDNANKLQGGFQKAGIEKSNGGMLTICDDNETAGSLEATGGKYGGSGIGGNKDGSGYGITITGGTITATGGPSGAGIGGGYRGNGGNITIAGGTVTAIGGVDGAGIGGGVAENENGGNGSNITITGGVVVAKGGEGAAGIGGGHATQEVGSCANGSNIVISGGSVTAIGGKYGAGIGGGKFYRNVAPFGEEQIVRAVGGYGKDITISGNAQVKVKGGSGDDGKVAAGIGNGTGSTYEGEGQETGDFSGLTEGGFVEYYASGADISTAASYVRHYDNTERHEGDITVTEAVAATCTTTGNTLEINCSAAGEHCGTVLASEIVNTLPHSYKTEWTMDDTFHWHVCSECGAKTDEAKHTDAETKDHICDVCGKYFSDENAENEIGLADTVIEKLAPSIIKGDGQTVTEGDKKALEFTSDAAFEDFIRVEIDGKELSNANYTVQSGSTVVTLNADYVSTLSAGERTLGIVSQSGTATAKFTVNKKAEITKSPKTGDNSNIFLWLAPLFVSGGAVIATTIVGRKKRRAE